MVNKPLRHSESYYICQYNDIALHVSKKKSDSALFAANASILVFKVVRVL